jgi:hypothetical protein
MKSAQRIAVALALISCAGLAQASMLSLGNSASATTLLAYGDIASTPNPVNFTGTSSDDWYFNITSSLGVQTALALYSGGSGLMATLFKCTDSFCTAHGLSIDSVHAGNSGVDSLMTGFYEVFVTSSVTGPGQTYSMYVAGVPLPPAVWLLLSGIAGLAATARRRKPSLSLRLV